MLKHFPLQRLVILFGVFALLFSVFLVITDEPTVRSDDPAGTVIESNDSQVTQQGSWTSQSANGASGGSYLYSSGTEDDALILPFQGSRIEILYVKNPSLGDFAIEIDNTIRRTVVTTSEETSFGNSAVVDYLEDGPHVVKIFAVEGTIAIDAFIGTPYSVVSTIGSDEFGAAPLRSGEIKSFNNRIESSSSIQTIHEPGASFIKVHFAEMNLADGDTVTVSNPDGTEVYTYPGSGYTTDENPGFWAFSIIGDTAIVEIHGQPSNADMAGSNITIDKYTRGYSETEFASVNRTESVCSSSDLQHVACYSGSNPTEFNNSNAVALILFNGGANSCTAWRISPGNYMLTNQHCIDSQPDVVGTEVRFNYQQNTCGGAVNTGTMVSGGSFLTTNEILDFTLFTVNNFAAISSFGYLAPDVRAPILNEQIYIPQHPDGQPKQFGIASDSNTGNLCRIDDVSMLGLDLNNETDTGYRCDTDFGSSGSPVIASSSNRVIALHHLGSGTSSCNVGTGAINSGVRMDLIYPYITTYFNAYKPTTPALTAPSGTITNTTPTYTWNAQANASAYKLVVNNPSSTTIIETWYSPSTVGCGSGTGTCSVTPSTTLSNGAHQWWIEAWSPYASAWSTAGNFTVNVDVPAVISKISPVGDVSTNPPSFSWTADADATYYHLVVTEPSSTTIIDQWYTAANAGCPGGTGTCTVTPSVVQQAGTHQWWVHGSGSGGTGPWGSPTNFNQTNGTAAPQIITTISPTGDTADNTPTYTWNADTWAEWYYLYVMKGSTVVMNTWYSKTDAGCAGGTGTCSITPTTVLSSGAHKWFIVGWNSLGTGPWSAQRDFNVTVGPPTTATTLVSPIGGASITTRKPTFTWNAHVNANQYYLYINGPSGVVLSQTFTSAAVSCATTCSYTPTNPLLSTKGSHSWWIQVINDYGAGPWSGTGTFTYNPPAPGAVTLSVPDGTSGDRPTYTWSAEPNSTWYYLYVSNGSGTAFSQWYTPTNANCQSGTGNCSVTPSTSLPSSFNYQWWVQSYNDTATAWSIPKSFTVGFNSQFQNSATGWVSHTGTWLFDNEYLYTNPSTTDLSTASNSLTFYKFDYQARIQRTGCSNCANLLIVRGTPGSAATNPGNNWDSGYRFQILRDGRFSVFRIDSASNVILQNWTASAAINQGDAWNTLRVVGNGSNFSFYINGTLVWSGSDATYSSGRVGVGMYRTAGDTNDEISVDWATLTVPAASASPPPESSISPAQRALNEAANRAESTGNANNAPATETSSQAESSAAPPRRGPGTELPRE